MARRLPGRRLDEFLAAISTGRKVFALEATEEGYNLAASDRWDPGRHTLGAYRPVEPLKSSGRSRAIPRVPDSSRALPSA